MAKPFMAGYKTHAGPRGNAAEWKAQFSNRMGLAVAKETLGDKSALSILGLAVGATWKEIKSAYRRLALETHPDRGGSAAAFAAVHAAYEILEEEFGMG